MRALKDYELNYIAKHLEDKLQVQNVELGEFTEDSLTPGIGKIQLNCILLQDRELLSCMSASFSINEADIVRNVICACSGKIENELKNRYVYNVKGE